MNHPEPDDGASMRHGLARATSGGSGGHPVEEETPATPLRILVVDDHEIVREGLVAMLERRRQFTVVAQAGTIAGALIEARRFVPDLVLMDVRLPDGTGMEACRAIRAEVPTTRVVFLTSSPEDADVFAAILAGAAGYVLKQSRASVVVAALTAVGRGDSLLDSGVTGTVLEHVRRIANGTEQDSTASLTEQERRILALLAEGKTNKEIAGAIYLSDKTVKNYVSSILSKLKLARRSEAPAFVTRNERQTWRRDPSGHSGSS